MSHFTSYLISTFCPFTHSLFLPLSYSHLPLFSLFIPPFLCSVVPPAFRQSVFYSLHSLSHPGVQASQKLVASHFLWPKCGQILSIGFIYACYVSCQRCIGTLFLLSLLFLHLLLVLITFMLIIVGPLPPSNDQSYLLTYINRFTHWPEAIPMADMTATTIAQALLSG